MRLARQGWPLVCSAAAAAVAAFLWAPLAVAVPLGALALFTVWFFRDPQRVVPADDAVIVAPADGRVLRIETVFEPRLLKADAVKVSIFMSPLDVHVNRVPHGGEVVAVAHQKGRFFNAAAERASLMNENNAVLISSGARRLLCVQVAGFLARRIVCWVAPGQRVGTGERFGLIRFGSRVDLYLPPESEILLRVGQRTRAGETVVGYLR
ncbi:MAG: phosphatidylserine decarboxylase family protein [Pseudomonadota bacterium]